MRRLLKAGLATLLCVGLARADAPPAPPPPSAFAVVPPAGTWTAPAGDDGGGLCLERPAWVYTVEVRRYYEARIAAGEQVAEEQLLRGAAWGVGAGIVIGIVMGALAAR